MADLVGMRVTDARTKVAALEAIGNGQTLIVRHNNFWPRATDAAFIENRISVDVVLGRVIRAAAKG